MKHQITAPNSGANFNNGAYPDLAYELAQSELNRRERLHIGWGTWFLSTITFSGLAFLYGVYIGGNIGGAI